MSNLVKLVSVALLSALIFFLWFLMPRTAYHENWHSDVVMSRKGSTVNIPAGEPPSPTYISKAPEPPPIPPTRDPFALKFGVDYFADYNIFNVSLPPEPPLAAGQKKLFSYMNQSARFPFLWVSGSPRIAYVPNFITEEECDAIIAASAPKLGRSQVAQYQKAKNNAVDEVRTSMQTWLDTNSGVAAPVAQRIFELIGFSPNSCEMMQILRYEVGQKYDAHNDYFDPKLYGPQSSNRAVTVFLYLSDVEEGGHTWFPNADNKSLEFWDYKSCKRGLGIKPIKGSVVVFYDMKSNGEYDPWSLHGGCPVRKGTKWGGTLWFRVTTSF